MKKFFLLFIFVLATISNAFNISDYLYKNEEKDLSSKQISISDGIYTIYYVKNVPILFVFENSKIINDSNKIGQVLRDYYSSIILLNQENRAKFEEKIKAFNKSRDLPISEVSTIRSSYGTESYCLQSLALVTNPCNSQQSCLATANIVCALFATGGGQGDCDPYILGPAIYDYYSQILILNSETNSIFDALSSLSIDNAADKYSSILKSISSLEQAAKNVNSSRLMFIGGDIGVCYNPKFDFSSLNEAREIINSYNSNVDLVKDLEATVKIITANTAERLSYSASKGKLELLQPRWQELKTKYSTLFEEATNYSPLISDNDFVDTYKKFFSSWHSIENKFSDFDSAFIEDDINMIENLAPKLKSALNKSSAAYLKAYNLKQEVDAKFIYLKYSLSNSEEDRANYLKLEEKKKAIDKFFSPPLTSDNYKKLEQQYLALKQELEQFLSNLESHSFLNLASEAFGHSTTTILFSFTDSLAILSPSQKKDFAPFVPPLFLLLIDLAILSTFSVIFFGTVIKFKPLFKKKNIATIWIITFLLFLFLVLVGSVAFYFVMDSSQKSAKLPEFFKAIKSSPKIFVVISDVSKISPENLKEMLSCSNSISEILKNKFKKEVYLIELGSSSCKLNSKNKDFGECQAMIVGQPTFELRYSNTEKLEFALLYEKKATYYGSKKDFESCSIKEAFKSYQ